MVESGKTGNEGERVAERSMIEREEGRENGGE